MDSPGKLSAPGCRQCLARCDAFGSRRPERTHRRAGAAAGDFAPGRQGDRIARAYAANFDKALARLQPREAEIFALRFFEDRSNQEIAQMLGILAGACRRDSSPNAKAAAKRDPFLFGRQTMKTEKFEAIVCIHPRRSH